MKTAVTVKGIRIERWHPGDGICLGGTSDLVIIGGRTHRLTPRKYTGTLWSHVCDGCGMKLEQDRCQLSVSLGSCPPDMVDDLGLEHCYKGRLIEVSGMRHTIWPYWAPVD